MQHHTNEQAETNNMASIDLLAAVRQADTKRYYKNLSQVDDFYVQVVSTSDDAIDILEDRDSHVDVLVIDNNLEEDVVGLVMDIRKRYPRLLIVLVDEEADFGMPGQADDMSTDPFTDNDLVSRIEKMISERRMETLRSDSLPAVRSINKSMRDAQGVTGKQEAAVQSIQDMGYDYVAYYHIAQQEPLEMELRAQIGPNAIMAIAPKQAGPNDLMGWVAQNGHSRIAGPDDRPNHPLVARGRLGAISCVPVGFNSVYYGVLVACQDVPNSITQEHVLMIELVATQLASALHKELKQ